MTRFRQASGYTHILWDWNGTLLDDVPLCVEIVDGMLNRRGLPSIDTATYRNIFDFPVRGYYERAGFDLTREPFALLAGEFCGEYAKRLEECRLHQGTWDLLEWCAARGLRQSLLSATEQGQLEDAVADFGLTELFEHVIGQSNCHAVGKAERARELVSSLDVDPEQVVLVGDTVHDAHVAERVGVVCVLVEGGHQHREKLDSAGVEVLDGLPRLSAFLSE